MMGLSVSKQEVVRPLPPIPKPKLKINPSSFLISSSLHQNNNLSQHAAMTMIPPPHTDQTPVITAATSVDNSNNNSSAPPHNHDQKQQPTTNSKYHALVLDSGAIIKQTSLYNNSSSYSLLHAANSYYTVPAVLSEIRDAKSRQHLEQFQLRLHALHNTTLQTRLPSKEGIRAISEFARKTGDYSQLSSVDLQVLSLLYDLELEAAQLYNDGKMDHVRKEPKRVLGVCVKALNGGGNRNTSNKSNSNSNSMNGDNIVNDHTDGTTQSGKGKDDDDDGGGDANSMSTMSNAELNGIIDAEHVDIEYDEYDDDDDDDDEEGGDDDIDCGASPTIPNKSIMNGTTSCSARHDETPVVPTSSPPKPKSWAQLVNPQKSAASTTTVAQPPLLSVNYSTAPSTGYNAQNQSTETKFHPERLHIKGDANMELTASSDNVAIAVAEGQFDDASSADDQSHDTDSSDDESNAINIANAPSDDEFSDEECDVFILEPHEAVYFKKLRDNMKQAGIVPQHSQGLAQQVLSSQEKAITHGGKNYYDNNEGLDSEFPSLAAAAAVPYEGSDDENEDDFETRETCGVSKSDSHGLSWQQEEEERKKKALQPMINGRVVKNEKKEMYNSFRRHGHLFSVTGAAEVGTNHRVKEDQSKKSLADSLYGNIMKLGISDMNKIGGGKSTIGNGNQEYKSRILGTANTIASSSNEADFTSEMTAEDDDGEGWVTCTSDIHSMKAKGSLSITNSLSRLDVSKNTDSKKPGKDVGSPSFQRAACATTDFAMQNVILQMNLELLSVDGVRVRRLKTWVTRCGACFTIYGSNDSKGRGGGRLFCDKCGSNALQRIAASVDRNTGRLKLHMKKNYQYNTRGTKFSLPKPGKGNKYKGDLLLAEDQLLYGAWNQKLRMGKPKAAGQSIFGSDLASDLGCISDLTKRDDIRVGFGRRNPNSSKFGRERRGKKKKNTDEKACGLRRY